MPSRRKKAKSVPFNPAEVASIAKSNPYVQRLLEDAGLRDNVRAALDSTKNVYERLSDGKTSAKALLEDKKVQADLRKAVEAVRDVTTALTEQPKARARKGISFGRKLMVLGLGGALALVGSEQLRSKVLDVLFGAEEEFEYTPPATTPAPAPAPAETSEQAPTSAA
jgi:CRISPR-associated protein (TIGR02584 family)